LCGSAIVASSCGGSEGPRSYPAQVEKNFVRECVKQPGATESYCRCTLAKLEKTMSFDEFKKAETAAMRGEDLPDEFHDAVAACRPA
jgi:hypothetical protein